MKKEHQALFYAMLSLVGTFSTLCNSVHCCRSKCYEMLEGNVRDKRADCDCNVQVYDGFDSSSKELTPSGGYRGNNLIPNTTFRSSGPVVFVEFTSSMVLTKGFFELIFDLGKLDFLLYSEMYYLFLILDVSHVKLVSFFQMKYSCDGVSRISPGQCFSKSWSYFQ